MTRKRLLICLLFIPQVFLIAQDDTTSYSFFTAGHTYGSPYNPQFGLYPFLMAKTDYLNSYDGMAFGCLVGDVVIDDTAPYWDAAEADMEAFNVPVYIAAGGHDVGAEYELRFGEYYYSFTLHKDLFIFLTPYIGGWNIVGDQKDFLFATLDSLAPEVNHIFVFLHELVWWSPDSIFQNVEINYEPYYPGSTNFFTEIEPVFNALPNQVVFYAGDLGAVPTVTPFMYHQYENITLIASGMGGGVEDNMIVTDVTSDTIIYHLIALNGDDMNALGELTDFSLNMQAPSRYRSTAVLPAFPNPMGDHVNLDLRFTGAGFFTLTNVYGNVEHKGYLNGGAWQRISTGDLPSGLYIFRLKCEDREYVSKILKL